MFHASRFLESPSYGVPSNTFSPRKSNSSGAGCADSAYSEQGANARVSGAVSRCRLATEVAGQLLHIYNEPPEKVMDEYKRLVFLIGEDVEVHPIIGDEKSVYTATAIDIDENASLVVKMKDGTTRKLSSGEVSLKSANYTK